MGYKYAGAGYFTFGAGLFLVLWILLGEVLFGGPAVVLLLPHRSRSSGELLQEWEASYRGLDHATTKKNALRIYEKYGSSVAKDYIDCHQSFASYSRIWPECNKLETIVRQFDHPAPKLWWQFW